MNDFIDLPPLPKGDIASDTCPVMWVHTDQQIENYAREAIKADRKLQGELAASEDDWVQGPYVTDTVGKGWCVRIDGTDIFQDKNQYGVKGRITFQIASGFNSQEEAEGSLREWLQKSTSQPAEPEHVKRAKAVIGTWPEWKRDYKLVKDTVAAERVKGLSDELQGLSDRAYCQYIETLRTPECLGWEHKVKTGKFGEKELKAHNKASEHLGRHRAFSEAIALLARYGNAEQPSMPDQALLISMATCLYHGFGLLDQGRQESMLHDMRKLWDEVMGRGYYTPSNRERYISMLAAAPKFGEEQ